MNELNPIEFLVYSIALLTYAFTNFHLTRLICDRFIGKIPVVIAAHLTILVIGEAVIYIRLRDHRFDNPILLFKITVFCHYISLFLYERRWKQNLHHLLKLFAGDCLFAKFWLLFDGREDDFTDWLFLSIVLVFVKLFVVLQMNDIQHRREKDRIAVQMRMYQHQMELMEQSQEQIRFLRHDMKNHLLHMNRLLLEHDTKKLLEYVQETAAHLDMPQEFVCSGNRDIDSLLNYKLLTAQQLGSELVTDVKIPAEMQIPAFDLNVILGNLLDNALDALKVCNDRRLTVSLRYDAGLLYIFIENTCAGKPPAVSVKGAGHGLGLHSVRRTLERYHGELKTDYHDRVFTVTAMLYLNC